MNNIVFLGCLCIANIFNIQAENTSKINRRGKAIPAKIYKTQDQNLDIDELISQDDLFVEIDSIEPKTTPKDIYWIRLDLTGELQRLQQKTWYLRSYTFDYSSVFLRKTNKIEEIKYGDLDGRPQKKSVLYSSGIPFTKASLIRGKYLYLKVQRVKHFDNITSWWFLYLSEQQMQMIDDFYSNDNLKLLIPVYIFIGICLTMFIFTVLYFAYSRKLEFLYYACFILLLVIYLTSDILKLREFIFGAYDLKSYTFYTTSQVLVNLFYILFVTRYLNTKQDYPKLGQILKYIAIFLALVYTLDCLLLLSKAFEWHIHLLNFERLVMTIFSICASAYLLLKAKNKLSYFVVIGSLLYLSGALGLLFFNKRIYMLTGSSLEILIFAGGLVYKVQKDYQEKLAFKQEAYINKSKALRAQINPHFIFNSLNSIQYLVTKNEKSNTLKYLSNFSRLMRNLLESSIETNALLSDEIKMLDDYLSLESLRFNNELKYKIEVDNDIDTNTIELPFMILQPLVENAIIHGLLPKKDEDKILNIRFKKVDGYVYCVVEDNGIGRPQKDNLTQRKSRGIEITKSRLDFFNDKPDAIEVTDKVDDEDHPTGTKIIIKLPLNQDL